MTEKEVNEEKVTEETEKKQNGFLCFLRTYYKRIIDISLTVIFMGLGLSVLIYYLTGPALGYFHSDCSDSLLWSQAMIDSGKILSKDFYYAAILPFGSPLYMVPVLKLFGFTMRAQIISTCIFAVLFLLSALSMFRAMRWRYSESAIGVFCLAMLLSGSVKLREIMWEHVIYYSLSLIFLMLAVSLTFRLLDKLENIKNGKLGDKIGAVVYCILLLSLSAGIATDGLQLLALTVVPIGAAIVAYTVFDGETKLLSLPTLKKCSVCAVMGMGAVVGMFILSKLTYGGEISAGYADAYSGWSAMSEWVGNIERLPEGWFSLFGATVEKKTILFSLKSAKTLLTLLCSAVVFICPFVLFAFYKKLNKYEKLIAWTHTVIFGVTAVGCVCGRLSNANWRLTPLLGSAIIGTLVLVRHLLGRKTAPRRVGALLLCLVIAMSFINVSTVLKMNYSYGKDDPLQRVADTLVQKGYTRGYATFWQASEITLRSDSKVMVVTYEISGGEMIETHYQTNDKWFDDVEGQENYFVIFTQKEFNLVGGSSYIEKKGIQIIDRMLLEEYIILICDKNIF